jgi:DNA polymerase elongation subunit (family B)
MVFFQPCDWIESDDKGRYIVDAYGRNEEGEIGRVRITGFCPYFYIQYKEGDTPSSVKTKLERAYNDYSDKKLSFADLRFLEESKLDAMNGFSGLAGVNVWKVIAPAIWLFKSVSKAAKGMGRMVYETNLPPLLRLFHILDISPASPFKFESERTDPGEDMNVDVCYTVNFQGIIPDSKITIPLLVASYDLEVYSESGMFPVASNSSDEIIQIGVSLRWSDSMLQSEERYVLVIGDTTPSEDPTVKYICCKTEKELLLRFERLIRDENPDILCGYNTFGFDDGYIAERAEFNHIPLTFGRIIAKQWGRGKDDCVKTEKKTFELASGKFAVRYIEMPGRMTIDLLLSIRREQNLDSYKLDNVASTFLRDKVSDIVIITGQKTRQFEIHTKNTRGLFVGNLVRFDIVGNTINPYADGMKFKVVQVLPKKFIIELESHNYLCTFDDIDMKHLEWCFGKDDVGPKDIFASHHGSPDQRALIAKYCIQDCDLVLTVMAKLDTLVNARGMADVCRVPITYIFLRGQGIKIYSAVVYNASKRNQIILTQEGFEGDSSYEGAIVLPPKIGMYLDQPISVLDFNSLYPSNMIAFNLSPDTLVYVKEFNTSGKKVRHEGTDGEEFKKNGYKIDEISYDVHNDEGESTGRITCGFAQPTDDKRTVGLLPLTLDILLKKRKETRKIMEKTEDEAQKAVLNGLQLAYKVVANSVYGQAGSKTSPIRKIEVAACTTAAGRERIQFAKSVVEKEFGAEVIYGDTDSIFIKFPTKDLAESIELGKKAAQSITSQCRAAHKIEYEKTLFPFILFCRKRYVGMKYEDDVHKCKRMTMGVALKRRDNAPIVKDVFGGALDILMEHRDIKKAQEFVKNILVDILQNKIPLEKYVITKQLRDDYKNPGQIAHRVLADRMEERDAGNKPQVGDRLAFIYVKEKRDAKKQGDRIEQVDYVKEKKLTPDTEFYITNQVQNPVAQLFALAIEQLDGYKSKNNYKQWMSEYMETMTEEEATLKILDYKEKELDDILFMGAQYLKKHKRGPMDAFLRR